MKVLKGNSIKNLETSTESVFEVVVGTVCIFTNSGEKIVG